MSKENHSIIVVPEFMPKAELEDDDAYSSNCSTPTSTTIPDSWVRNPPRTSAIPSPGGIFMIRSLRTHLHITLEAGELRASPKLCPMGGWHWRCDEKDGWLGFRNVVSGTYMGHDTKGKIHARVQHHKGHEFFCARRVADGGYVLLMRHDWKMLKMAVKQAGSTWDLVETEGEGVSWEFIEVQG